jgi:hypothetical protein
MRRSLRKAVLKPMLTKKSRWLETLDQAIRYVDLLLGMKADASLHVSPLVERSLHCLARGGTGRPPRRRETA